MGLSRHGQGCAGVGVAYGVATFSLFFCSKKLPLSIYSIKSIFWNTIL